MTLIPVAKGFQKEIAKELGGTNNVGRMAGDKASKGFGDGFSRGLKTAGIAAAAAAALGAVAAGRFFSNAITSASNLNESINAVNVSYGQFADDVLRLGDDVAQRLGLSQVDFNQAAVRFSAFAETIAGTGGDVAGVVDSLTTRAADFASVFNIEVSEALATFQSGLAGEAEPLKRFGINLLDSQVQAFAYANGIAEVGTQLTESEKVQARYGLLLEETAKTQGDFANTSDQLANSQRIIKAEFEDMAGELGMQLLPAVTDIVDIFATDFMPIFAELAEHTAPMVQSVLEGVATIMREALDPTSFFGEAVGNLRDSFETLIEVMAPADDQIEGTIDLLGSLANLLSVLIDIISSFTAFISTIGPAFEALNKGDFQTFFDWLSSDPVEWRRLNVQTTYSETGPRPMIFPEVDVSGISDSFLRAGRGTAPTTATATATRSGGSAASQDMTAEARQLIRNTRRQFNERREEFRAEIAEARANYAATTAQIEMDYQSSLANATAERDASLAEALKRNTERVASIQADFANRLNGIIQQSMDRLRDAYRSAVEINVASIFDSDEIAGSIDGTIETMRQKLIDSRQLMANAAALSAAGFSQTFIEQIVGAGTEVGNEMAQAILNSSPEQQAEMRELFGAIETEAETGMDQLAATIYEKNGLATQGLRDLYAQTQNELVVALAEQEALYQEEMAQILQRFDEAVLAAKERRDAALLEAEEDLTQALLDANESFVRDIERIEEQFNSRIESMKGKIRGLTSEISGLLSQVARAERQANERAAGLRVQLTPFANGGLVTSPTAALIGEAGPEVVIPLDRFESMMGMGQGGPSVNYYAAPNLSLDSEQELFMAMKRAKVVVGW